MLGFSHLEVAQDLKHKDSPFGRRTRSTNRERSAERLESPFPKYHKSTESRRSRSLENKSRSPIIEKENDEKKTAQSLNQDIDPFVYEERSS